LGSTTYGNRVDVALNLRLATVAQRNALKAFYQFIRDGESRHQGPICHSTKMGHLGGAL